MRAIVQIVQNDFTLQWRYRIIAAYAVVIAIYFVLIRLWAAELPDWVVPALIYSDPAVLGFFFLGGLMMLERGENVRAALASSPMSAGQYLVAKSISLTAIALGAVLVLSLAAGRSFEALGLILLATTCASIFFIRPWRGVGDPVQNRKCLSHRVSADFVASARALPIGACRSVPGMGTFAATCATAQTHVYRLWHR